MSICSLKVSLLVMWGFLADELKMVCVHLVLFAVKSSLCGVLVVHTIVKYLQATKVKPHKIKGT